MYLRQASYACLCAGAALALASCAAPPSKPTARPSSPRSSTGEPVAGPDVTPSFASVSWILGDWQRDGVRGSEHWVAAAGALYGVSFTETGWEVMIIDDASGPGPADGKLRFYAMPGGHAPVEFGLARTAPQSATFTNPSHDFPTVITYSRDADRLRAVLEGPSSGGALEPYAYHRVVAPSAPALEAADRALAAASRTRGADAWVAAFDAKGGLWTGPEQGFVRGADAIRATMTRVLAKVRLEWEPTASRLAFSDSLGFTVGRNAAVDRETSKVVARASYVTVWRRQPDGAWKVLLDMSRIENRP